MNITASFNRSAILCACLVAVAVLSGCASPITHDALVPSTSTIVKQHAKSVAVITTGGADTTATGKSSVSDTELQQAVAAAITQSKVFSRVVEGKTGDYVLSVTIFNMVQPSFGFSFTVTAEMGWSLTRADTGAIVWRESLKSEHTATTGDAFAGVARLRLATEGAIRKNIEQGLGKISNLSL